MYILYNNKIVLGELPIRFGKSFVFMMRFKTPKTPKTPKKSLKDIFCGTP